MTIHELYMQRCLELARRGAGYVAPNPMVGAVLVNEDRIIGEGWHRYYGAAHAEVNCIDQAIQNGHAGLLKSSVLYVSLEPCAHYGKTPPCTELIIRHKIPRVIIGCLDPNIEVNARLNDTPDTYRVGQGKGIEKLKEAGIKTEVGVLEDACKELNKRFITFHKYKRPYIVLKWAETLDGYIGAPLNPSAGWRRGSENPDGSRLLISNEYTNRLVHKWRSEESAILVGTNTALLDDPELNTRHWPGPSPIRLVVDMELKLPSTLRLFNRKIPTIIFNEIKHSSFESPLFSKESGDEFPILYYKINRNKSLVKQIAHALYELKILSVLVEGGAKLLQSFLDEGTWDEVRRISNRLPIAIGMAPDSYREGNGLNAPEIKNYKKSEEFKLSYDVVEIFKPSIALSLSLFLFYPLSFIS